MNKSIYAGITLILSLVVLSGCRTDQALFGGAVYTGFPAILGAIIGIIYVMKRIL